MADARPMGFLDQQVGQQRLRLGRGKVQLPVAVERYFKRTKQIEGQTGHIDILALISAACIGRTFAAAQIVLRRHCSVQVSQTAQEAATIS